MTVENQFPYQSFTANGSQTNFALGFYVDDKNHFEVKKNDQAVTKSDYSYNKNSNSIVFNTPPNQNDVIEVKRITSADRATTYATYNNTFRPETLNKDLDRIWLKIQELGVADQLLTAYTEHLNAQQQNYIENQDQLIRNMIADLRNYINQQDDTNKSFFENLINQQGVSLRQLNDYYQHLFKGIAGISTDKGWLASLVVDQTGKSQQELNNIFNEQTLSTKQFYRLPKEIDDTGLLQRAFDESFSRKQKLYLVGDFNVSDTIYARHNFDGSSSTIIYPQDFSKDMLVFSAEKSITTTRITGKTVHFPNIETTKTSTINSWVSNTGSCAIKIINPQECKFTFGTTNNSEFGVYILAYNTDANYNQYNFGRHVFHKRPATFHVQGDVSVASMNQNTLTGGRFAVSLASERVSGIYLMHFLITGSNLSSINNNLVLNPSVEGGADEYAILFESLGSNISGMSYNTIIAPRLETGNVPNKKIAFSGNRVRWNRIMQGYGVHYDSVFSENGAGTNSIFGSTGAICAQGSLGNSAPVSFQNVTGVAFPTLAVYPTGKTLQDMNDATQNSVMYATSIELITRSATTDRFKLAFANGKHEWLNASGEVIGNLYPISTGLKNDFDLSLGKGIGLFGTVPPTSARSITGKKTPSTIEEQNAVLNSIVSALVAYGFAIDSRTI